MSNFIRVYEDGQNGLNLGLTTGIGFLDDAIRKIQKKASIGLAAAPKVGMSLIY
jgi:replicative DNA helicase